MKSVEARGKLYYIYCLVTHSATSNTVPGQPYKYSVQDNPQSVAFLFKQFGFFKSLFLFWSRPAAGETRCSSK